jgi:hypothetical protein
MPQDKDKDEIPKRLWRQLRKLELQMREQMGRWVRVRDFQEKIELVYAIKLMETYLSAELGEVGNLRDQVARQFLLEKLLEFYRW